MIFAICTHQHTHAHKSTHIMSKCICYTHYGHFLQVYTQMSNVYVQYTCASIEIVDLLNPNYVSFEQYFWISCPQ